MSSKLFCSPLDYSGSDADRINQALAAAAQSCGIVRIPRRRADALSDRDFWLIDSAILLPANTTLILDNCTIKLSDNCRDNFIRSANCGPECGTVPPISNIHISGVGCATLEGADHPRATGDSAKPLGVRTYGTDAGKSDECQTGDWRNIGILLVRADNFSITNIKLKDYHCWGISLEYCTNGKLRDLEFSAATNTQVDGKAEVMLNRDGLDLRRGCRNIFIDNIHGVSGDDLVALTAIGTSVRQAGIFGTTEMCGGDENVADGDVCNIVIRNVRGYTSGRNQTVRFLNTKGVKMHHIILDGVMDTSPADMPPCATVRIGDANPAWGGVNPLGETYAFTINNIFANGTSSILIGGSLCDSIISNVISRNPEAREIEYRSGKEYTANIITANIIREENK